MTTKQLLNKYYNKNKKRKAKKKNKITTNQDLYPFASKCDQL